MLAGRDFRKNVEMAKSSSSLGRPQRKREGQKISANYIKLITFRWQAMTVTAVVPIV